MKNWAIDNLQDAWYLVSKLHKGQTYGGTEEGEQIEYINHIGSVVFEIMQSLNYDQTMNKDFSIICALLHDTIEDTNFEYDKIIDLFGKEVADGVSALTKNTSIKDKQEQMKDSLLRIKQQPKELWAVKMADRICNLYAPPYYWTNEKKKAYHKESLLIYNHLKEGNNYLANRLKDKIDKYVNFF
jgi:(p)ppGpp synthase/HD superfamily hydrolase